MPDLQGSPFRIATRRSVHPTKPTPLPCQSGAPVAVSDLMTLPSSAETFLTPATSPPHLQWMQSYLEKRDPAKNQDRFYSMAVLPNLFGEWTLRREWGRIGASGQVRLDLYQSHAEADEALLALEDRKRRRGYFMEPQQLPML